MAELAVIIPTTTSFYTLYADGLFTQKIYEPENARTILYYPEKAVLALYYTYPNHRAASLVRNVPGCSVLPGLSRPVRLLFTVHASKVDKLKRVLSFLSTHAGGAFSWGDDFYTRLYFLLHRRGKLNYPALRTLACRAAVPAS
ncbi:MAG: hypothetical protein LBP76_07580 [Treponema sp.]|jgi:hypothetical protein|nr:hypothetical protein [Treponema sp.]